MDSLCAHPEVTIVTAAAMTKPNLFIFMYFSYKMVTNYCFRPYTHAFFNASKKGRKITA